MFTFNELVFRWNFKHYFYVKGHVRKSYTGIYYGKQQLDVCDDASMQIR